MKRRVVILTILLVIHIITSVLLVQTSTVDLRATIVWCNFIIDGILLLFWWVFEKEEEP
jgi:hypothetical protein